MTTSKHATSALEPTSLAAALPLTHALLLELDADSDNPLPKAPGSLYVYDLVAEGIANGQIEVARQFAHSVIQSAHRLFSNPQ